MDKMNSEEELDFYEENNARNKLKEHFADFCENTKMYGFNYLRERGTTKMEKLYWLLFICLSVSFSGTIIVQNWHKWNLSHIVVSTRSRPIWEVPFPAITICPQTKIRQSIYNFTDYYHQVLSGNVTDEEYETFSVASLLCDTHLFLSGNKTTSYEDVMTILRSVSPPLPRVFLSCKSINTHKTCNDLFTPVITDEGLCFTFNMLEKQEIFTSVASFDDNSAKKPSEGSSFDGHSTKSVRDEFPRKTPTSGPNGGVFVLLTEYPDDFDYVCRGPVEGFKVHLHQPSDFPRFSSQYFRASLNQEVVVAVEPHLETTSEDLRNYDAFARGCFFHNERRLKFFKNYSHENCKSECLANFTLSRCGCVGFYMPHEEGTMICGSGSNRCAFEAEQELLVKEVESEGCNCLPGCTSLWYSAETSQANFNWKKLIKSFKTDTDEFPGVEMARLTVFFKNMRFSAIERSSSGGNFLAHCGGVLAFFCGFSFLTLAEIIYFLSLRIICKVKEFGGRFRGRSRNEV